MVLFNTSLQPTEAPYTRFKNHTWDTGPTTARGSPLVVSNILKLESDEFYTYSKTVDDNEPSTAVILGGESIKLPTCLESEY